MKSLLITGATGFIGSYLLDALIKKNQFEIIVLKRKTSNTFRIESLLDKVEVYNIDETSLEEIFKQHNTIEGIVHLATHYVKTHESCDIENMIDSNVKFPTQLLEIAVKSNVQFFINTGTFFEYSTFKIPLNEKDEQLPFNLYAATKAAFDNVLKYYAHNSSLNILTLKLGAPFGYKDNFKLIPFIIDAILNGKTIDIEKSEQEWDFIYVKDVVSAYLKAIFLCLHSTRNLFEDVLIGTGKTTSIKRIASILSEVSQTNLITHNKEYSNKQIFLSCIDNSKAKNLLQWVPQYSIEKALEETFNLYKENKR
ncbi:MAG: NAD(P)-dependent oxidoreductase [Arcobacteraceae bacterium]